MDLMPEGEEQVWLVRALKDLVDQRGWRPFVLGPILEPNQSYFPESPEDSEALLDRTARRLLHYADLGNVDVELEIIHPDHPAADPASVGESPVWIVSFDDPLLVLGVRADFSPDAEDLAGVLSHVVAQAFRRRHGLEAGDDQDEPLHTEVTSVFLGFGILAANSALRYRSGADLTAGWAVTSWEITSFGVLTPQALTYLLALQCYVRQLDKRQLAEVRGYLEANQAAFFSSAIELFAGKAELLQQSLGIPRHETWPVMRRIEELPELPAYDPSKTRLVGLGAGPGGEQQEPQQEAVVTQSRYPTFRVRQLRPFALWGAILAGLLVGGARSLFDMASAIELLLAAMAFGGIIGFFYAKAHPYDMCSDPECETVMPDGADACPGCGRAIKGRIRSPSLRLHAEERILEEGEDWVEM